MGLAIFTVTAASHFVVPIIEIRDYNPQPPTPEIELDITPQPTQIGVHPVRTPPPDYTINTYVSSRAIPPLPTPTPAPTLLVTPIPTIHEITLPAKVIYNGNIQSTSIPTPASTPAAHESIYETNPKLNQFTYINDYSTCRFSMVTYGGVDEYFEEKDRKIYADLVGESYRKFIDDEIQDIYMDDLMDYIRSTSPSVDEQAIAAVRFVQNIPYDEDRVEHRYDVRYPYQVIYDNEGVCSEKSLLLIYILSELGYDTSYIQFEKENHAVVGIKCNARYEYRGTGYCFVESTRPTMITYSDMEYGYVGKLESIPYVIHMSDGRSLKLIENEWRDANKFSDLTSKAVSNGGSLSSDDYNVWFDLVKRYGIIIG